MELVEVWRELLLRAGLLLLRSLSVPLIYGFLDQCTHVMTHNVAEGLRII